MMVYCFQVVSEFICELLITISQNINLTGSTCHSFDISCGFILHHTFQIHILTFSIEIYIFNADFIRARNKKSIL